MSELYKKTTISKNEHNKIPESKMFRGISTVNDDSFDWGLYDIAIIKQDLINHFHIRQGEKLNDPRFGTIIWELLYEPLTEQIKSLILDDVNRIINYDPRIRAERIELDSYEHGIIVECTVTYIPYNITESMRFMFDESSNILKN